MIIGSRNKGDWSEFYTLVYLLGTRKLYTADEELNRIEELHFPIKKVFREEKANRKVDFVLSGEQNVEIYLNDVLTRTMTSDEFSNEAILLYPDIIRMPQPIDIPHGERFLNSIFCERLAAPSTDITDIRMELHDTITGINQVMGFSIKSYLGGAPTLLNASGATNFKFKVDGITDAQMTEVNSIETQNKIRDRIKKITELGGILSVVGACNSTFSGNLMMIDSKLEEMISIVLLYSYVTGVVSCKSLVDYLEDNNPLHYPRRGMYEYKFKKFLCAKALGMDPSKEWNGIDDSNGGYIVVKSDGDVLAYHLYNRDKFEQYLLDNTKLERGSTTRHKYAFLYKENDEIKINLNLQIRFI